MGARLQVTPATTTGFEIRIGSVASIGRLPDSTVCLASGPAVSRQHAVIRSHNGYDYQIIDLGSLNGTYVNGQRVVLPARLENGACIRIADNEIVFQQTEESSDEYKKSTLPGSKVGSGQGSNFAALMVCDIRGFTTATETLSKSDLAQTVGGWFRRAGNFVQQNGGNIDKFMGDAFFAYWTEADSLIPACETALQAGRNLLELARTIRWSGANSSFEVVVALHCGNVSWRNIGMIAERDATLMGDAVNTVFRLESVAKELNRLLLASGDFLTILGSAEGFTDLGERTLKGKRNPLRVYGFDGNHEML